MQRKNKSQYKKAYKAMKGGIKGAAITLRKIKAEAGTTYEQAVALRRIINTL